MLPTFDNYTVRLSPRLFAKCLDTMTRINRARQEKATALHRKIPALWDESDAIASILEGELLCRKCAAAAAAEREEVKNTIKSAV